MAAELSRNVLWHGINAEPTAPAWLSAGPVAAGLEEGQLRGIYVNGRKIVQRIYGAVRDRYWNTVPGALRDLQVEQSAGGFRVRFTSEHVSAESDFVWRAQITGTKDGTIRYEFDGEARREMLKNRIGLCVLLPLSFKDETCVVEYVSGDRAEVKFPVMVDPAQPVRGLHDFRELRVRSGENLEQILTFEGDVFEIEDQRNWTDASFKIYSTPQRIPLPAKMPAGQRVHQVVTLRLSGNTDALPGAAPPSDAETVNIDIGQLVGELNGLGVGTAYHGIPLTERELMRLKNLRLSHYHVETDPLKEGWMDSLRGALREAEAMGAWASVGLALPENPEIVLASARQVALEFPGLVRRWLLFTRGAPTTRAESLTAGARYLAGGDACSIGGGTDADFFQLNNNRPAHEMAFVSVPLRPCAHQFDRATLVENLTGQREVLKSMAAIWPQIPLAVTPVSLRTRAQKGPATAPDELPPQADVRQMSLFGAAWTIGSIKAMAESGVANPTLFQTTGLRGIMELEAGSTVPREFHSIPGGVFPVYIALSAVTSMLHDGGAGVMAAVSDAPLMVEALVLKKDPKWKMLVVNYTPQARRAALKRNGVTAFASARAVVLDATNAVAAMTNPEEWLATPPQREMTDGIITLPPFALAWVDMA